MEVAKILQRSLTKQGFKFKLNNNVCGSQRRQHQGDSGGHEEGQDIRGIVVSFHLLWSLMSKMSTTFQSISYGPCSRTGVTCVASDFANLKNYVGVGAGFTVTVSSFKQGEKHNTCYFRGESNRVGHAISTLTVLFCNVSMFHIGQNQTFLLGRCFVSFTNGS